MAKATRLIRVPSVTVPERHLDIVELTISPRNKRGMVVIGQADSEGNPIPGVPNVTLVITTDEQYDALYNDDLAALIASVVASAGVMFQQMPAGTKVVLPDPPAEVVE
jgi:hypothetical protein